MIEELTGLPDGVIGFEGHGKIHADDYRDVLLPAVEGALAGGGDLRIVLVFAEWDGLSGGGFIQDLKMGTQHLTHWKKIALVTDLDWMVHVTHLFGWMTPGELKHFSLAERDEAIAWTAA